MAVSLAKSLSSWISDIKGFQSFLNSDYYVLEDLNKLITIEHLDKVKKGVKQLFFWKRKLGEGLNNNTVILGLLSKDGLIRPSAEDIWNYVGKTFPAEALSGIYHAENSNFIGLTFFLEENAHKFRNEITFIGEYLVLYIEPNSDRIADFRLLWIPPSFPDNNIKNYLMKYSESVAFEHENTPVTSNFSAPNNVIMGRMKLKSGINKEDIPHIIKLEGYRDRHMLVIIRARVPLCLRCKNIGHIRKNCTLVKCLKCTSLHPMGSPCASKSYSSAVNNFKGAYYQWTEEVTDPNEAENIFFKSAQETHEKDTSKNFGYNIIETMPQSEPNLRKSIVINNFELEEANLGSTNDIVGQTDHMESTSTPKDEKMEFEKNDVSIAIKRGSRARKRKNSNTHPSPHKESCQHTIETQNLSKGNLDEPISNIEQDSQSDSDIHISKDDIKDNPADNHTPDEEVLATEITSAGTNIVESDEDDDQDDDEQTYTIRMSGFPNKKKTDQVIEFLTDFPPIDCWYYTNDDDTPNGTFGAAFDTEKEAMDALKMHGQRYKNRKIHMVLFS